MKKFLLILGMICFSVSAIQAGNIKVAVAANVQYTFEELQSEFEKESGIQIKPVIGSSGKFTAQIENGAPFDVFLSADMDYPKALEKEGLVYGPVKTYAYGTLVLWTIKDISLSGNLEILADFSVRKIAIASPKTAPYGRQAVNAMKFYHLYERIHGKLVYGESIAQVNQFITTSSVDLGLTSKSIVLAPNMKDQGKWVEIPREAYEPIAQGVVILKHSRKGNLEEAQKFFDFLFSEKAGNIFKRYGYILP